MQYYKKFFDVNENKMSNVWKGIRSIANLNNTSKKDIKILNKNGKKVTDPQKIVNLFNEHYVNVGPNIEKKLPKSLKKCHQYLSKVKVAKTFFLKPVTPQEIFDIILSYNAWKTLGPNGIPIYILKISNNFF